MSSLNERFDILQKLALKEVAKLNTLVENYGQNIEKLNLGHLGNMSLVLETLETLNSHFEKRKINYDETR